MIQIRGFIEFQRLEIVKELFGCKDLVVHLILMEENFQPFDSWSF